MQNEQQGFKDWPQRISLESRAHYLHYLIWSWTEKAPDEWKMQNWDEGTGDRRVKPNHLHSGSRQVIWKQVEDCTVNSQHEWVNYVTVAFSIQGQFSDIVFLWPQRVTMLPLLWQCSVWKQWNWDLCLSWLSSVLDQLVKLKYCFEIKWRQTWPNSPISFFFSFIFVADGRVVRNRRNSKKW